MRQLPDTPIATLAAQHLREVKRTGDKYVLACCPFHKDGQEETPSFSLNVETGWYRCFACEAFGPLPQLLRVLGMSWESIERQHRYIIEDAQKQAIQVVDHLRPKDVIFQEAPLPHRLLGIFDYCPNQLLQEGFTAETLRHFDVGIDTTHKRITYPLFDLRGHLVGISGRAMEKDQIPRYKLYHKEYTRWNLAPYHTNKAAVLWNAHRIYADLRGRLNGRLIVVEGFKAAMWLYQMGYHNVVALLGIGLTAEQLWILESIGADIYLMLDRNDAGARAQPQLANRLSRSQRVYMCSYAWGAQPSDLRPEEVDESLTTAARYTTWQLNQRREPWSHH